MWDRIAFKATGKANFKSNYWPFVAVSVLYLLLLGNLVSLDIKDNWTDLSDLISLCQAYGIQSGTDLLYCGQYVLSIFLPYAAVGGIMQIALSLLVANPYEVGASRFFLENTTFHTAPFSRVSMGFTANFGNVVLTQFLRNLYIFLWSLLFLVPGIVRAYGYFAVPYILAENPHMPHQRALELSRQMTMGYKADLFVLDLSFFGWQFLNVCTFNILGIFYVNPYVHATKAEAYRFLRVKAMESGITSPVELPGMGSL